MVKKILIIFTFLFLLLSPPSLAQTVEEVQQQIAELSAKLTELNRQKNTLSNQIKIFDTKIAQIELQIKQTGNNITVIKKEIADLSLKINGLDVSLNDLSGQYIAQINQNYKLQKRIPFFAILGSGNLNDFFKSYKYITSLQQKSQDTLVDMETTRTNLDLQKQEKSKKQAELEALEKKLASQQKSLSAQKASKDKLLQDTKNDEAVYQRRLQEAQAQLASFRRFADSVGGSTCLASSPGGGSDGNFYSQRDPRWCNQYIGNSSDTIGAVGCYISSVTMVHKKAGNDSLTPSVYAHDPNRFFGNTAYMLNPLVPAGYSYRVSTYDTDTIDKELSAGRYVIAQMRMSNIAGMHFVVIISGSNGNYQIHDPWFGPDQNFSSRYSPATVMSLRLFTK